MLQGLALGGEYGGAGVYVGEHSPDRKRGLYTSFIQITAILGLCVSLLVILGTQSAMSKENFTNWGWRIPFLLSLFLVCISIYIRLKLRESPIFAHIKAAGKTSIQPLKDAFTKWPNLKQVLVSLLAPRPDQAVVPIPDRSTPSSICKPFCNLSPPTPLSLMPGVSGGST